jgi:hypothetical protein
VNIEETVAFILDTQSQTSATLRDVGRKLDAVAEGQKKLAEGQKKFDRSLEGIRKLIVTGMKMIVANERSLKELAAAQKQTDKQLKAFLASMEKGRNGRNHS